MSFEDYLAYFESILADPESNPIYKDPEYYNYTKLNWSRMNRWLKKFEISEDWKALCVDMKAPQRWIVITEPWCGDAAHALPQIYKMVNANPLITLDIQLRDAEPFLIEDYLTNNGKSIPKVIIRDHQGKDIAVWGPRPKKATDLYTAMKAADRSFNAIKEALQKWYNEDAGLQIQGEFVRLLR